jgi:Asp-tRNA(Asn)/Glu-tRNA(Gln) amidotransferase A subunit family amidase
VLDSLLLSPSAASDLVFLSATEMAAGIRERKFSSLELIETHIARIERINPSLNAFLRVDATSARERARAADEAIESNAPVGPLHGVPISIKSSIEVAGMPWEAGTKLRAGTQGENDAPLVERLRAAGAIVLGVTNTPELLMAWETDNLLYGRTNNPWDLSRTPGGSSGGESAAIAAGLSAAGVGSDGGGSIRVPAHFSGICGLKPTPGRIPASGHFPESLGPFALLGVVGPMARAVADLKLMFEAMQGLDDGDPSAAPIPIRWPNHQEILTTRIGYFEDDGRTPVTSETRQAVRTAAEALRSAGFAVEPFRPEGLELARQVWWEFFGKAGGMLLEPMLRSRQADVSPILREFSGWVANEPPHTADSLLAAWMQRDSVRMEVFRQMREYPILLCPVASIPAYKHGERSWPVDGQTVKYLDAWSYCEWFNLLGNPAAVVPVGRSREGLPIGVQLAGRPWEEELVLSVAEVLEKKCGGWQRPPI